MKKFIKFDFDKIVKRIKGPITAVGILWKLPTVHGSSFLLNYKGIMVNRWKYDENDVINYILLAAKRDYNYAKTSGDYTLDADFCRLSREELDDSRLMHYHNNRVYFLYEELERREKLENGNTV